AEIRAAIPGKIVEIKVKVGEKITDQQCLLVLESMKMRNEILSPIDGIVDSISVGIGDQVTARQLMIKLKPTE
ncbi:MAG: acetyl-CoA carboxylase biotin carboxyl carrier protein subunit, partial [Asgard group archaeon]|nr:acetyl-CoA carboxylase biotin carboxyl carrier protein subunit [Asgard group archaeon]